MRCKNCDYPLWNLPTRKCPECGLDFKPSEFHYVANSVRFCCPHCEQSYYGTTEHGHLIPRTFSCVKCAQRIDMDDMLLRPAEGVDESRTAADVMPWLQRKQFGTIKAWFRTIMMALVTPQKLMRAIPKESGLGNASCFTLLTQFAISFCGVGLPLAVIGLVMMLNGSREGPEMLAGGGIAILSGTIGVYIVAILWALLTHGLLRISGTTPHGFGRTAQAMLYSSAGIVLMGVPCVGSYCGGYFVWIWWMVSAILMVVEGQKASGLRATLCVGAGPALAVIAVAVSIISFAFTTTRMVGSTWSVNANVPPGSYAPMPEANAISNAMQSFAIRNNGRGPAHGIELVQSGALPASTFVIWQIGHDEKNVALPAAAVSLDGFQYLPTNRARIAAQQIADAQPSNVIAHRVGDVVFTYHGMNLSQPLPGVWIAVICPDPDQATAIAAAGSGGGGRAGMGGGMFNAIAPVAILADGSITTVSQNFANALQSQNALRATFRLPPLPDLATIRNTVPAVDEATAAEPPPEALPE